MKLPLYHLAIENNISKEERTFHGTNDKYLLHDLPLHDNFSLSSHQATLKNHHITITEKASTTEGSKTNYHHTMRFSVDHNGEQMDFDAHIFYNSKDKHIALNKNYLSNNFLIFLIRNLKYSWRFN